MTFSTVDNQQESQDLIDGQKASKWGYLQGIVLSAGDDLKAAIECVQGQKKKSNYVLQAFTYGKKLNYENMDEFDIN